MDPATIAIITSLISSAISGGSSFLGSRKQKKLSEQRAKEMERGTYGDLLNQALQGQAELQGMNLDRSARQGKRRTNALMNTAATLRDSFNI